MFSLQHPVLLTHPQLLHNGTDTTGSLDREPGDRLTLYRSRKKYYSLHFEFESESVAIHDIAVSDDKDLLTAIADQLIDHPANPRAGSYVIAYHLDGWEYLVKQRRYDETAFEAWVEYQYGPPKQQTNFQESLAVNTMVGNLPDGTWGPVDHQRKISQSEWDELCDDGITARDMHELRDGIADKLFTVYGIAARAGIDADADYRAMMVSQMSKFDMGEEDAAKTRDKYERLGMSVRQEFKVNPQTQQRVIVTYSACEQLDHQGRMIPEGKWLKSHNFQEPIYTPMTPLEEPVA